MAPSRIRLHKLPVRLAATAAVALALVCGAARGAEPKAAKLGEGAQRLVGGAVKFARARFGPEACLDGVDAVINASGKAYTAAGAISSSYNAFNFTFAKYAVPPGADLPEVYLMEALGAALPNLKYNQYSAGHVGGGVPYHHDPGCISEMSIDSGDALALANKSGLVMDVGQEYHAYLRAAASPSKYFTEPGLSGKTFWIVGQPGGARDYFIDAKTGRLLLKKKP